mgnify:FL=1
MKNKNGNKFKKPNIKIPTDHPRPWSEINEGEWVIFNFYILKWMTYLRPKSFNIYGYSKGRYTRIYWGMKVLHFKFKIRRIIKG